MTPLGRILAAEIRESGPIGVDRFMARALGDPEHGYYRTRDPLGRGGDFITAPEISQIFGEIVGLWLAEQWRMMGEPGRAVLVELGPGRGTLMADLLRALRVLPACRAAAELHLVETSPVLRDTQHRLLAERHPDIVPHWHEDWATIPPGPTLLVANEFFDALPIRQWVRSAGQWQERLVGLDLDGGFAFVPGSAGTPPAPPPAEAQEGAIFETCEAAGTIGSEIGGRLTRDSGVGLLIDYGHAETAIGETLQAVRTHRYAPVLTDPGEADLTAHVDFAALGAAIRRGGAATWGPMPQGRFLIENGAALREQALTSGKAPEAARPIRHAVRRLLDPAGMGRLFKVLAATAPKLPRPAGF